jgi:hypothetical protein
VSADSRTHSSAAGAFQLGVVWPPCLQPCSRSERLPPVYSYLPAELVGVTALQHNEKLTENVKTWLSSHQADFFDKSIIFYFLLLVYKNVFPDTTSASVPAVTTLRSSLSMFITDRIIIIIIIIIIVSGVRLSPLGTAATTGLLYQPQMIDDCEEIGGMKIGRGTRSTRRKPAPAPLCPPQIPHDQTGARTRTAAVGSQRLTAWAMAQPGINRS